MQNVERIPQIQMFQKRNWPDYLLDTLLAIVGAFLVTGIIYFSNLYPKISDISILYLLVILALALWRGTYAAILAAVLAFLTFDFFLVPPLFSFTIAQAREWVALVVFLVVAIITSLLAATARQRTEQARLREREARILYELMRVTNDAERLEDQLDIVALSILRVFSSWGTQACALLLPGTDGKLAIRADAPIRVDELTLTPDEWNSAADVLTRGQSIIQCAATTQGLAQYLVPLKTRNQVLGVLYLRIRDDAPWLEHISDKSEHSDFSGIHPGFFWTFLDQATSLVERGLLREEAISRNG